MWQINRTIPYDVHGSLNSNQTKNKFEQASHVFNITSIWKINLHKFNLRCSIICRGHLHMWLEHCCNVQMLARSSPLAFTSSLRTRLFPFFWLINIYSHAEHQQRAIISFISFPNQIFIYSVCMTCWIGTKCTWSSVLHIELLFMRSAFMSDWIFVI